MVTLEVGEEGATPALRGPIKQGKNASTLLPFGHPTTDNKAVMTGYIDLGISETRTLIFAPVSFRADSGKVFCNTLIFRAVDEYGKPILTVQPVPVRVRLFPSME